MKKTLVTLLALTGIAAADTSIIDNAYIGFSDFSTGVADYGTKIDDITVSTVDSVTTLTGVTFDTPRAADSTRDCYSITLVLDASKIGSVNAYTSLAAAYFGATSAVGFGVNQEGKFQGQWGTEAYNWLCGNVPTTGTITLTFTTGEIVNSSNDEGSRLYIDDSSIYYSSTGLRTGNATFDTIKINNLNGAIEQVYVHNYALTKDEVGTLMTEIASLPVPEPTTATLSLLALAGLAARRRRK